MVKKENHNNFIPVVIPSYEPDQRLLDLLKDLISEKLTNILIIDDGSASSYQSIFQEAEKLGARVIHHKINLGKGAALKTALSYCMENIQDFIGLVTADSDGQHTPRAIGDVMERLWCASDSLVLGSRDFDLPNVPEKSRIGNVGTNMIIKVLYNKTLKDTQTGLRGIPKSFIPKLLELKGNRFEYEMQMLQCAFINNINIEEVPIETVYDSRENHATHFRPIKDTLEIYKVFGIPRAFLALLRCKMSKK